MIRFMRCQRRRLLLIPLAVGLFICLVATGRMSQAANYFEPAANVRAQLGRGIAGGAPTVTLNLAPQGLVYPDRLNTVDMRFTPSIMILCCPMDFSLPGRRFRQSW